VVNKEYIVENLCENKDKPELKCQGTCHLKKELIKNEERKTDETKTPVIIQLVLYCNPQVTSVYTGKELPEKDSLCGYFYLKDTLVGFGTGVFHPPSLNV